MTDHPPAEARIARLIRTYADDAPTSVDAVAMTRLAATTMPSRASGLRAVFDRTPVPGRLAIVVGIVVVSILAGTLVAGALPVQRVPDELQPPPFVEPFGGLPPDGASPSQPETGALVMRFAARIHGLGGDVHVMAVYDDGRLLWKRNLEGGSSTAGFGGKPRTTAVIEQRLSPSGVELLRRAALAELGDLSEVGPDGWVAPGGPGVIWGGIEVYVGDGPVSGRWSDSTFPMRLADPGSWLPATAWADARIGGYVPSHFVVCTQDRARLPDEVQATLVDRDQGEAGVQLARWCPMPDPDSFRLTLDDARAVGAELQASGFAREELAPWAEYRAEDPRTSVVFIGILPHGEPVGYGG